MKKTITLFTACLLLGIATPAHAQDDDTEALKLTALEALVTAPPERAMPIVERVLAGDGSDELKARALFVLSQMDTPEARARLRASLELEGYHKDYRYFEEQRRAGGEKVEDITGHPTFKPHISCAAMTYEILNGHIPPENVLLPGTVAIFYWPYHALLAALSQIFDSPPPLMGAVVSFCRKRGARSRPASTRASTRVWWVRV